MFRCNRSKIDWYLKRNLADIVPDCKERVTIRLRFEPKGMGWAGDGFYLQDRENRCCVCGSTEKLTKHHVVPYTYRQKMGRAHKTSNYYDVLPVCVDCHSEYEYHANLRKQELAKIYNAPLNGINNPCTDRFSFYASTILKHGNKIPAKRKQEMLDSISSDIGRKIEEKDIVALSKQHRRARMHPQYRSHAQLVLDCLKEDKDVQRFVEDWRRHFLEVMKPKFLPSQWEVERDFYGKKANKEN